MRPPSPDDPHFLHGARPLEALVSPPIDHPRALAWRSGDALLVAARDGTVHEVEPAFGTRALYIGLADPAALAVANGRVAVLARDGRLEVRGLDGAAGWSAATGGIAGLQLAWWTGGVAVAGDDGEGRFVTVYDPDGRRLSRGRVPPRTALGTAPDGQLRLAASTEAGLSVRALGAPPPPDRPTDHALRFTEAGAILGVATGGVTVWHGAGAPPVSVKLYEVVNAALSRDGDLVAMGTREGGVALAAARVGGQRANPSRIEGHDGSVLALAFSPRGRWLASAAGRCWVWSY